MRRLLRVEFRAPFHHGSGFGFAGLVDRTCLRDGGGLPYLAGSAIKGRLKHAATRILASLGEPFCRSADGRAVCRKPLCAVCRIFGSVRKPGTIAFRDGRLVEPWDRLFEQLVQHRGPEGLTGGGDVRIRTAVNRTTRTVCEGALYSTETLPPYLEFEAELIGDLEHSADWELVGGAAAILTHFGADAARGLGRCSVELVEEKADDSV